MSARTRRLIAPALALVVAGCAQKPASVRVSPAKATVYGLKRTLPLTGDVLDRKNEVMLGQKLDWKSSKPEIATVEKTGIVHTVAPGKTVITAGFKTFTGVCALEVVDLAKVAVTPLRVTLAGPKGTVALLKAEARDSKDKVVPSKMKWLSDNPKVAVVSAEGLVTSVGEGRTTVSAGVGEVEGAAEVTVTFKEIGSLEIGPPTVILKVGESQQLRSKVADDKGVTIENASVNWTSSDTAAVSVYNGVVTGVAPGASTIRGVCGSKTAEISVLVN